MLVWHIARGAVSLLIALLSGLGFSAEWASARLVPVQKFLTRKIEGRG